VGLERVCLLVHTKRGMKPLDYELVELMERYGFVGSFIQIDQLFSCKCAVLNSLCFLPDIEASTS
jgi:hypothetical protein